MKSQETPTGMQYSDGLSLKVTLKHLLCAQQSLYLDPENSLCFLRLQDVGVRC